MKFLDRKRLPALHGVNSWISLLLYKMLFFPSGQMGIGGSVACLAGIFIVKKHH